MPSQFIGFRYQINQEDLRRIRDMKVPADRYAREVQRVVYEVFSVKMKSAARRAFPRSTSMQNVASVQMRGSARNLRSIFIGYSLKGQRSPLTGRPLKEYLFASTTIDRITVSPPLAVGTRTTPLQGISKAGFRRIKKWAKEQWNLTDTEAFQSARGIVRKFKRYGMPRQPILSQLIKPQYIRRGGGDLFEAVTNAYQLKTSLRNRLATLQRRLLKEMAV